mgnify:CR=1 FL=1
MNQYIKINHVDFYIKLQDFVADNSDKVIKRKYWALVIGKPAKQKGRIVAPLKKVRVCVRTENLIAVSK